jgi:hypothetical protein
MVMEKEIPLFRKKVVLEKYPGKGGWTYAQLDGIKTKKNTPFGFKKVKGSIDNYQIKSYHIMPMGNGNLFLPVKAEIRKKIKKQAGDLVFIELFIDSDPLEIPQEMLICLEDAPEALVFFNSLSESNKRYYMNWIYSAKQEQTKVNRMAKAINRLLKKQKLYDPELILQAIFLLGGLFYI